MNRHDATHQLTRLSGSGNIKCGTQPHHLYIIAVGEAETSAHHIFLSIKLTPNTLIM